MKIMIEQRFVNQCPATFCQPRGAYPELFAIVGGQTPDLRGLFLRGHGGNSAALGVQQGDAIRQLTGITGAVQGSALENYSGAFYVATHAPESIGYGGVYSRHHVTIGFDASRVVPTANENRPANTAVRFLIRAHP